MIEDNENKRSLEENVLFDSFRNSLVLSVSQGQNANEQQFRDRLDRLAQGKCTAADHEPLMTCAASQIPDFEMDWEDVLRSHPTREALRRTIC